MAFSCALIYSESGLLQKEYPGIAISVKTRQSIRSVLNTAMDTIHNLRGGGLLDETEAMKLEKVCFCVFASDISTRHYPNKEHFSFTNNEFPKERFPGVFCPSCK